MTDLATFAHGLNTRVCPLYRHERRRAFLVGTGIPISTPSGAYIVTATHVLEDFPDSVVLTAGSKSLIRFPARCLSYGHVAGKTVDVDIGTITLPAKATTDLSLRYHFTTLEEFGLVMPYNKLTLYAVVGYPHSRNKPKPAGFSELRATPTFLILREFADVERFGPSGKRSDVHFGLQTHASAAKSLDSEPLTLPKLQGMSGGGVWRIGIDPVHGTVASAVLVGVGIEHHERESTILCTRIQYVLPLLKEEAGSQNAKPSMPDGV